MGTRQRLWLHDVNVLNATGLIVFKGLTLCLYNSTYVDFTSVGENMNAKPHLSGIHKLRDLGSGSLTRLQSRPHLKACLGLVDLPLRQFTHMAVGRRPRVLARCQASVSTRLLECPQNMVAGF